MDYEKVKDWLKTFVVLLAPLATIYGIYKSSFNKNAATKNLDSPTDPIKSLGADFKAHKNLLWNRKAQEPYCLDCFHKDRKLIQIQTGHSTYKIGDENSLYPFYFCPACGGRPNISARPRWRK